MRPTPSPARSQRSSPRKMPVGSAEGTRSALDFQMLGPLRVLVDGQEVPIATRRQRALLVLLLMSVGRVVPTERLIEQLGRRTATAGAVTLRVMSPTFAKPWADAKARAPSSATRGSGYVLDVAGGLRRCRAASAASLNRAANTCDRKVGRCPPQRSTRPSGLVGRPARGDRRPRGRPEHHHPARRDLPRGCRGQVRGSPLDRPAS